jgi:hypothetical protein
VSVATLVTVATAAHGQPRAQGFGTSITLRSDDEFLRIQLLEVRDPAHLVGSFGAPRPGNKLVAVELKLTNLGPVFYVDSPGNGTKLISASGRAYPAVLPGLEPNLDGLAGMTQGRSQTGRLTFEVPIHMRPWKLRYTLDSGYSDQTGFFFIR